MKYIIYGAENGHKAVALKEVHASDESSAQKALETLQKDKRYMFTYLWMEKSLTSIDEEDDCGA